MRVLIATSGSDGDVRPFFALARELIRRGHDVLFAASDHYEARAAEYRIPFRKVGPPWNADDMAKSFARILKISSPLDQLAAVLDEVVEPERLAVPELLELVSHVDVVISPPLFVAATAAARAKKIRHVSVQLAPVHPARNYSPTGGDLGPTLNRAMWKYAGWMLRRAADTKLNTIVKAAGLPPWRDVLLKSASSTWLDLMAVSPHVIPHDPDWPVCSRTTGYWFLNEPDFVVDLQLNAFVANTKPIVIGFGSMHGFDSSATTQAIVDAVRDLDHKVVIQSGWAGLGAEELPPNVFVAKFVPHEWLFGRAACVVHHGGAGTTAAALRAGVPQAIVWHLGDQPSWGKKVHQLGVGPAPIFYRKLNAKWLRAQLDRMLSDTKMQQAATAMGTTIQGETGVETAARMIEEAMIEAAKVRSTSFGDAARR